MRLHFFHNVSLLISACFKFPSLDTLNLTLAVPNECRIGDYDQFAVKVF